MGDLASPGRSGGILLRGALFLALTGILLLAGVVLVRTLRVAEPPPLAEPVPPVAVPEAAAARLAGAVRIPTISPADPAEFDSLAFQAMHSYLEASFPRVHAQLTRETVATHSLLYTWRGTDPSLKPILLAAHLDVVPVEPGTEEQWQVPPFGGWIRGGFVWGRGAIDNKLAVMGTLEAVEMLLADGFRPARTVYLAYGHDEEVGGTSGARTIAARLTERGVELAMVLDEGGVIGDGLLPGVTAPTALVGIAEKGFASVELSTSAPGGHSSLPPPESAIGVLSAAVARLEASPLRARLDGAARAMFERLAPEFALGQRAIIANLWATEPLVIRRLEAAPVTNAMIRTTTAVTIFNAGTKENVLPTSARAVVNFRILPGDSVAGVLAHVRRVVDDPRVEVTLAPTFVAEPSALSSPHARSYRTVERTIRSIDPEVLVAPFLVVVVTDARYYAPFTENVLRFLPVRLTPRDLQRIHGIDERVAVSDYDEAIRFYRQLLVNAAAE